ncbi:hypothetical protein [Lactiplantibacillus modestisalitolerans]|uniref:Integral membrane protein n=1 Tax=Lactiplantibacillus modestisalitolerans TaxID=1457219 RepID=A0ABV5WSD1_9LACO|nr:hypothetical protein [Lactiplantibacillus modestisalitolerans]
MIVEREGVIKRERQVSRWLVPIMTVIVLAGLALVRNSQWQQFVALLIGLILVDQCRPGRYLNHLVVHLLTKRSSK